LVLVPFLIQKKNLGGWFQFDSPKPPYIRFRVLPSFS
jgi:hypothetical protein